MREVIVLTDPAAVADAAERLLYTELKFRVSESGRFFVLLSGGSTPKEMYRLAAQRRGTEADLYGRADYFLGDERMVAWDSPDSNGGEAARLLLDPLGVAQGRRHFPNGASAAPEREADRINAIMERTMPKNLGGAPVFDLAFLGVGADGHTASLFPGTAALDLVEPKLVVNAVPQLQTTRFTATFPLLAAARHVVFLVTGATKAHLADRIRSGEPGSPGHPALRVRAERTTWLLDRAAAG
ncbi:MAG: 6-phosphogluconolactonase [Candidatus Sumerlaeia bacterium]|nr:6-phosphogluconolactonase [Candidatus Sumerlaeia bacterium]